MKDMMALKFPRRYNEHMGSIKTILDSLGHNISYPWLYGGTGHAFMLNMNDRVFVDCAMAWDVAALFPLYPNLGFKHDGLHFDPKSEGDESPGTFRMKQKDAWDFVRAKLDQGIPCYVWELSFVPMYYLITGYDDVGYYYSSFEDGGPCPWDKMATFDVRTIDIHAIELCEAAHDRQVVHDALQTVLARIEQPDGWTINERYQTGLPAWDMWAHALESGCANRDGHGYINTFWLECRENAVDFLAEAKSKLAGQCDTEFDAAIKHYGVVRDNLHMLLEMFPERGKDIDWTTTFTSAEGAQVVRAARDAEVEGIKALRQVLSLIKID